MIAVAIGLICKYLMNSYGISENEIQANIDRSNAFYGADHPNATRILYPNGEVDPWKAQVFMFCYFLYPFVNCNFFNFNFFLFVNFKPEGYPYISRG